MIYSIAKKQILEITRLWQFRNNEYSVYNLSNVLNVYTHTHIHIYTYTHTHLHTQSTYWIKNHCRLAQQEMKVGIDFITTEEPL